MGLAQLVGCLGIVARDFRGQVQQHVQPEVRQIKNLVALFHEAHRQELAPQHFVRPQFGGHSRQHHRLATTTRSNNKHVLAGRRRDVAAKHVHQDAELTLANDKLCDNLLVRLQDAGVELADDGRCGRHQCGPLMRFRSGT